LPDAARRPTVIRLLLRVALRLAVVGAAVSIAAVLAVRVVNPPLTPLMLIRAVEGIVSGDPAWIDHDSVPLDRVSPSLQRAVIAAEDARFLEHHGFDLRELERAWASSRRGERLRGASTITMQCARSVYLWPGRSWLRKGVEAWLTVLMELLWSKRRILEVYLNVVEWGDGIYGAEAAARAYFGVPASRLDPQQAALLAAALPSPRLSNPAAPSAYLRSRAARIRRRMAQVELPGRSDARARPASYRTPLIASSAMRSKVATSPAYGSPDRGWWTAISSMPITA
jgi:monofunctional biosynthetic peptidoglycan transglycosylase